MTHKLYKKTFTLLAICFLGTAFAQKFDKKFTEKFKVNKDVEVVINASNSEINVTTWNRNEVQIEAFIEIEGLSKEEAEKYFKKWNFEALGNKNKVSITSKGSNYLGLENDIVFFNNKEFNVEIPEIHEDFNIEIPVIDMPDLDAIIISENNMNYSFDYVADFDSLDRLEENMKKNGKYSFEYKTDDKNIVIKTEKEWKKFKKTKEYKELKKELEVKGIKVKKALKNAKHQIEVVNKVKLKEALKKAKIQIEIIDKVKIKKELAKVRKTLKNMKFSFHTDKNELTINGKKIKIKKRIEVKVPKKATFNLNTRHCKVKLPDTVASGKVKYGSFDANNLNGGELIIDYSPVNINSLNGSTLFLNNVTDANIASVTNTTLNNNSSEVKVVIINNNVNISDKFGKIIVDGFGTNFGEFVLNLSNSEAELNFGKVHAKVKYNVNKIKVNNHRVKYFKNSTTTKNLLKINGQYSSVSIK